MGLVSGLLKDCFANLCIACEHRCMDESFADSEARSLKKLLKTDSGHELFRGGGGGGNGQANRNEKIVVFLANCISF